MKNPELQGTIVILYNIKGAIITHNLKVSQLELCSNIIRLIVIFSIQLYIRETYWYWLSASKSDPCTVSHTFRHYWVIDLG